jgi:hypothetical protein
LDGIGWVRSLSFQFSLSSICGETGAMQAGLEGQNYGHGGSRRRQPWIWPGMDFQFSLSRMMSTNSGEDWADLDSDRLDVVAANVSAFRGGANAPSGHPCFRLNRPVAFQIQRPGIHNGAHPRTLMPGTRRLICAFWVSESKTGSSGRHLHLRRFCKTPYRKAHCSAWD